MLSITYTYHPQSRVDSPQEHQWRIGEPVEFYPEPESSKTVHIHLQADGDELELIINVLDNIPASTNPVVVWRNDMARFVMDNCIVPYYKLSELRTPKR